MVWGRSREGGFGNVVFGFIPFSSAAAAVTALVHAYAERLASQGIETRPFFLGMHEQPVFRERGLFANESYPVAERLARQGLYLPSGLAMDEPQLERVCRAMRSVLG